MQDSARLAFLIYLCVTLSKGLWFPYLPEMYFWVADIFCFVVLPVGLVIALKLPLLPQYAIGDKKPKRETNGTVIFLSFILSLVLWAVYGISEYVVSTQMRGLLEILPARISYTSHIPKSGFWAVCVVVYFALTAGLVEEYFFRGLLNMAMPKMNKGATFTFVVMSTICFASIHWGGGAKNLISCFWAGLVLALAFVRTRDIRICMLGHGLFWLKFLF